MARPCGEEGGKVVQGHHGSATRKKKKGGVVPSRVYKRGEEKRECRVSGEGGCHAMPM
jgi:hypothetical protein